MAQGNVMMVMMMEMMDWEVQLMGAGWTYWWSILEEGKRRRGGMESRVSS
jgi:hypothetical protein